MLKSVVFIAALLGSLSLVPVSVEAHSLRAPDRLRTVDSAFILTLEGKLVYEGLGPHIPECDPWIGPALETGGTVFGLDFRDNLESRKIEELFKRADKLYGKRVRVTGRLEKRQLGGLIPTTVYVLVVSDLQPVKPAGVIRKTVEVQMKGQFLFRADHADILKPDSRLIVNGKTYVVVFDGNDRVWRSAVHLDGHKAILTGRLDGDRIHATAVKADEDFVHKTITVEIRGKLVWNRPLRCLSPEFSLMAGEEYFGLEFTSEKLHKLASTLQSGTVILTGTLVEGTPRGRIITVTSLKADGTEHTPQA
jgi:hypothetical protein